MCTAKSLTELTALERKHRNFRIWLSLFGLLAVSSLIVGCSSDWWVVYYPPNTDKYTQSFTVNGNTGLWRSCISPNENVTLCESILSEDFIAVPDFLPGLIMTCGGTFFVTVAEGLLLFHIRFATRCLPVTSASFFILSGIVSLIGCLFLLLSFSFALPWFPTERTILTDFHASVEWSFLLTLVGSAYSVVFGLFIFLSLRFVKKSFTDADKDSLEIEEIIG
ncbi:uncharacterized protein [Apostichopus japonicus]|uniref:uncharacterized protein n=1 Tax=Stichopus japonicus TaxID=307972 RepID=UPI003AB125AB